MPFPASDVEGRARAAAFRDELRRLGWSDNDLQFDERWAGSDNPASIRAHAAELAASAANVILVNTPRALAPLQKATSSIPIVFVGVSDPVGAGFVQSLSRPGGNTTGFALIEFSIVGKLVEILKRIAPSTTRVAMMSNPDNPSTKLYLKSFEEAVHSFAVQKQIFPVRSASDIQSAIVRIAAEPNSAVLAPPDATIQVHRKLVADLAIEHRLPAIYSNRALVEDGGLIYYGTDVIEQFRQAAGYVDRVLKGAKPDELPVQQPTKFEIVINLRTAKAIQILVPDSLLSQANEVIE